MFQFVHELRASLVSSTPEALLQMVRARRRGEAFRDAGVAFVHVPRTAGTSVTSALYGRFIGHFGLADLIAMSPADVLALPRFTLVRNPWDRLDSAWSFARAGEGTSQHGVVRVHRPQQYAVPAFATFERFVDEWLSIRELDTLDGIFRPQHSYLLDSAGAMDFTHVGRLDDIAATEAWVSDALGRNISFSLQNASPREDYRGYYTPRLRVRVAELYAQDVALLGYDF